MANDPALRGRYSTGAREAAPHCSRERHAEETLGLLEAMMEI
jgi:hypothetical protein